MKTSMKASALPTECDQTNLACSVDVEAKGRTLREDRHDFR